MSEEAKWYVLHTYSGYEKKVKETIEQIVKNRGLGHLIQKVIVPVEQVVEGNKVTTNKIFPCYVMLKMVMNDETWYIGRNVVGSTGFVGPGSKPVPLTEMEVENLGLEALAMDDENAENEQNNPQENANVEKEDVVRSNVKKTDIDLEIGESVRISSGPYEGYEGKVKSVNNETQRVTVIAFTFNRETPVEIDYSQIEKLS